MMVMRLGTDIAQPCRLAVLAALARDTDASASRVRGANFAMALREPQQGKTFRS